MSGALCSILALLVAVLARDGAGAPPSEFHGLLRQARRGRPSAVRLLVRTLMPVVRARVRRFVAGRAGRALGSMDADDLAQEIWCKLLEDDARLLEAYDPDRSRTPQGYVGMLAQRELFNRLQKENALKRGGDRAPVALEDAPPPATAQADPEADAATRELLEEMSVHLEAVLPEKGLAVLRLLYEEGRDIAEAAKALGTSVQVVYNWQHRIRTEARSFLAALEGA